MANISIFQFKQSNVRIQSVNDEPVFCLSDVAEILNIKNVQADRFRLSAKGVHKMSTLTDGGKQRLIYVDEPNLYRVIFRSNKKEAVEFQNWVFEEVLPTIRKTGSYTHTINSEQQQKIQQAVIELYRATGEHYGRIYSRLHVRFKIPKYQDLPASRFDEAMQFLGSSGKLTLDHEINDRTLGAIEQVCLHFRIIHGWWKQYEPAISQLNPNIAACLEGSFQQGHVFSHDLERIFNLGLKPLNYYSWYPFGQDREARRLYEMDTPSKGVMLCDLSQ